MDDLLRQAIAEDLGERGDITSAATVPETSKGSAAIVARAPGCVAGLRPALRVFELIDESIEVTAVVADGAAVDKGMELASVSGSVRSILAGERLALNLLGHLSGVATATRALVERVEGTRARIVDTRKTTPLLRRFEKAAVAAGGGGNHRMGLYDAVLIKDNHIEAAGSAAEAVRRARARVGPDVGVEVEIERVEELEAVIEAGADMVMLDNMSTESMKAAVTLAAGRCRLEASGGITLETVRAVAETGVDWISVGWITHSAPALDVALELGAGGSSAPNG